MPPPPPGGGMGGMPPPPGGDPMAGGMPPGGDPMGGMGGGMGGMGGDPMGGGMGAQATPVPVKTIPVADVWKVLRRISEDPKFESFFDQINVAKNATPQKVNGTPTPKSLLR